MDRELVVKLKDILPAIEGASCPGGFVLESNPPKGKVELKLFEGGTASVELNQLEFFELLAKIGCD